MTTRDACRVLDEFWFSGRGGRFPIRSSEAGFLASVSVLLEVQNAVSRKWPPPENVLPEKSGEPPPDGGIKAWQRTVTLDARILYLREVQRGGPFPGAKDFIPPGGSERRTISRQVSDLVLLEVHQSETKVEVTCELL